MRICIVGCGAVGSLFAANLATLDDVEVWAFDLSQAHVDAINARRTAAVGGRRRRTRGCTRRATRRRCRRATSASSRPRRCTPSSAIAATAHAFADGAVARCMNGVGNEETLAAARRARDPRHDVPGRQAARARRRAVGRQGRHDVRARSSRSPRARTRSSALADACTRGGMPAHAVADARPAQWRKVIFNAVTNPIGALTGLTHGRVCERPDLRALVSGLVDEGKAVAERPGDHARRRSRGADRPRGQARGGLRPQGEHAPGRRGAPAHRDRLPERRHRRASARELGVPTPLNETITALDRQELWSSRGLMDLAASSSAATPTSAPRWREHELDALIVSRQRVQRLRGRASRTSRASRSSTATRTWSCRPTASRSIVFPTEARYVGEHGTTPLEQVFADRPGDQIAARAQARRLEARRRLRARLHHGRARLRGARGPRARAASTSSSTTPAPSRARPSSSRCATRCASTSAASRSSSRPTRRARRRPR